MESYSLMGTPSRGPGVAPGMSNTDAMLKVVGEWPLLISLPSPPLQDAKIPQF